MKELLSYMNEMVQFAVGQLYEKEPSISFDYRDRQNIIDYIRMLENEIDDQKDKLHRRNMQIAELKKNTAVHIDSRIRNAERVNRDDAQGTIEIVNPGSIEVYKFSERIYR